MRNTILCLIALTLLFQCCRKKGENINNRKDLFYRQIETSFPAMSSTSVGYINQPTGTASNHITVDPVNGYLVAANRVNNTIQLYDQEGVSLLSTVGGAGRGPAEFDNISQLHIGHEGDLYVLDIKLNRITKFEIENSELNYLTSYSIKPKGNISIRAVYSTGFGNFGVFHRIDDYETWEESYHFYKLDHQFNPVKHLIELPGNEKLKLKEHFYIDKITGRTTYWALNKQWFYYITSMGTQVNMYNIRTGEHRKEKFFQLENRQNTPESVNILMNRFDALIKGNPVVADEIQESEILPMFDNFHSSKSRLLFDVFYTGGDGGRVIIVDLETGDVKYLKTASELWRFALSDEVLYGIETTKDEGPRINVLKLK